jgi:hypothetical protein
MGDESSASAVAAVAATRRDKAVVVEAAAAADVDPELPPPPPPPLLVGVRVTTVGRLEGSAPLPGEFDVKKEGDVAGKEEGTSEGGDDASAGPQTHPVASSHENESVKAEHGPTSPPQ